MSAMIASRRNDVHSATARRALLLGWNGTSPNGASPRSERRLPDRVPQMTSVPGEDRAVGVQVGQLLVEPGWQPPRAIAHELHDRGQQAKAHDGGVDEDRGRQPHAELLD